MGFQTMFMVLAVSAALFAAPPKGRPVSVAGSGKVADPNVTLKVPESFSGVVMEATGQGRILGAFRSGGWTKAPNPFIGGTESGVRYSAQTPILRGYLDLTDQSMMLISFNLGIKNGKGVFRAFQWSADLGFNELQAVDVEDEGEVSTLADGVMQLLGTKYRFLLKRKAPEVAWEPTQVALYRFEGRAVETMAQPTAGRPHGGEMYPNQFVPDWTTGSYMKLSDGRFGRLYFRIFGTEQVAVWPFVNLDGRVSYGSPTYIYKRQIESQGREDCHGIFARGIAFDRLSGSAPASAYTFSATKEQEISTLKILCSKGQKGFTTIEGASVAVVISEGDAKEILARAKESGWAVGPSPFALGRQLLSAFRGITLVAPIPVYWNTPDSIPGVQRDNDTRTSYSEKSSGWKADIESVGGTLRVPEIRAGEVAQRPAPFGYVAN